MIRISVTKSSAFKVCFLVGDNPDELDVQAVALGCDKDKKMIFDGIPCYQLMGNQYTNAISAGVDVASDEDMDQIKGAYQ